MTRGIQETIKILKKGGVGVVPTDTLYGLVGRANDKKVIARIKRIKGRSPGKPFIILISSIKQIEDFGLKLKAQDKEVLSKLWPGPISVALTKKLSFRLPKNKFLIELINKTGPLVAPSANPEGSTPASTIAEARNYFDYPANSGASKVDFYLSAKRKLLDQPSTLISLKNGQISIIRYGKYKLRGI